MQSLKHTTREKPLVRAVAAMLSVASFWGAFQGPLDDSRLALALNVAELMVGVALALAALGLWKPIRSS